MDANRSPKPPGGAQVVFEGGHPRSLIPSFKCSVALRGHVSWTAAHQQRHAATRERYCCDQRMQKPPYVTHLQDDQSQNKHDYISNISRISLTGQERGGADTTSAFADGENPPMRQVTFQIGLMGMAAFGRF